MHCLESEPQQLGLIAMSLWEEGVWRSSGVRDYWGEWARLGMWVSVSLQGLLAKSLTLPLILPWSRVWTRERLLTRQQSISAQRGHSVDRNSSRKLTLGVIDPEEALFRRYICLRCLVKGGPFLYGSGRWTELPKVPDNFVFTSHHMGEYGWPKLQKL